MKKWFAVHTHPRDERLAATNLTLQGFEVFYPRYIKRRSHARKIQWVPAPLFPRYLFVAFDAAKISGRAIRSTRGAIDLVRTGDMPVSIPDGVIEEIRLRQDEAGYVVLARSLGLKRGDRITVDSGLFAACEAIFEAKRDEDRVVALLSLLGRQVRVNLPLHVVARAE